MIFAPPRSLEKKGGSVDLSQNAVRTNIVFSDDISIEANFFFGDTGDVHQMTHVFQELWYKNEE